MTRVDAVVVGGGFYGSCIAHYLVERRGLRDVVLIEAAPTLLSRASYSNQARIHNGYHYPRSFGTAYRSRVNLPRFLADWPEAVSQDLVAVYALARSGTKTNARQFTAFCRRVGAPLRPLRRELAGLLDHRTVEAAFEVDEWTFDALALARCAGRALDAAGVRVRTSTRAVSLERASGGVRVRARSVPDGVRGAAEEDLLAPYVFNCTYSGINRLGGDFGGVGASVKHELTEMALMTAPPALAGLGVTVMDGPFFSFMPFPARGLHTLSHVRYTPHAQWVEPPWSAGTTTRPRLAPTSRADRMVRDVRRFLPAIEDARHVGSLVETKTVLLHHERDDGRPILLERHAELPGLYSVLGGKIDNVYDVLERLDAEAFTPPRTVAVRESVSH